MSEGEQIERQRKAEHLDEKRHAIDPVASMRAIANAKLIEKAEIGRSMLQKAIESF